MTKKQKLAISFFLSQALFLGGGLSNILALSQKDSWIAGILGILLGIIIIYLMHYASNNITININHYLKEKRIINYILKVLLLIIASFVILVCLLSITILLANYYLPLTPAWLLSFSFIIICLYSIHKGYTSFTRLIEVLFPICLIVVVLKTLLLTSNMHIEYFLPILTVSNTNLFLAAIDYATLSTIPFIFIIDEKGSAKENIINYSLGALSTLIIIFSVTSVLGYPLMQILSFPEYAILRKIEFLNFIENIENIIAIIWLIDLYILLTSSTFSIKKNH